MKPEKPLPILELDEAGRHRIVAPKADGTCEASPWMPTTDAVQLGNLFVAGTNSCLPPGIISVKIIPHRVLV